MSDLENSSTDIMLGADAIANYLGVERRLIYRAVENNYLPTFRIGALICARRSALTRWIERCERKSLGYGDDTDD